MGRFASNLAGASLAMLGNTTARMQELSGADTIIRTPLPLSRRLGFVQLRGGAGASSTAAYVASVLARRRSGLVLGVNASAGETSLTWYAGVRGDSARLPSLVRANARGAHDAVDGLPRTRSGLYGLDLQTADAAVGPIAAARWFDQLTPITRFFDVVVTDWGSRWTQVDLGQVASASHVVCLVTRADRHALEEAAALVPALREQEDAPRVVLATVDVGHTGGRAASVIEGQLQTPVIRIPYDSARGAARPVSSTVLATRTRIAYTTLATAVMNEALR